jgi:hypothetical protein
MMPHVACLLALLMCVAGGRALAAAPVAGAEELLARLIERPAPAGSWTGPGFAARQNIPAMDDLNGGMLGTTAVQRGSSSLRYMVYLSPAIAKDDFTRLAYPPKEQSAGPMQERTITDRPGSTMVCGQAWLSRQPPRKVETCSALHPTLPLIVRSIEAVDQGSAALTQRNAALALRHAEALMEAARPPTQDASARLYRALRTVPMPRSKDLARQLESLAVVEEDVRDISKADGVIGRLSMQGRGVLVRYVVFGSSPRMQAWYERTSSAPIDGYRLANTSKLTETGAERSLRDPFSSRIWVNSAGSVLCDAVALHRSVPLGLRIVLPLPNARVTRTPGRPGEYSANGSALEDATCMFMATELAGWATERGSHK